MTKRRQPEATVLPVHFEDRSGAEFERLAVLHEFGRVAPGRVPRLRRRGPCTTMERE
jgi:hypothetical protein